MRYTVRRPGFGRTHSGRRTTKRRAEWHVEAVVYVRQQQRHNNHPTEIMWLWSRSSRCVQPGQSLGVPVEMSRTKVQKFGRRWLMSGLSGTGATGFHPCCCRIAMASPMHSHEMGEGKQNKFQEEKGTRTVDEAVNKTAMQHRVHTPPGTAWWHGRHG